MMKSFALRCMVLAVCCFMSCKKNEAPRDTYILQGRIAEFGTGAPIQNAQVRVVAYHFTGVVDSKQDIGFAYSDQQGYYSIRPEVPTITFDTIGQNSIDLHVTAEGYNAGYKSVPYNILKREERTYTYDFQLLK